MNVVCHFERKPLFFSHPRRIISCDHPADLPTAFAQIERALGEGFYVAGFFSYEAGHCFEPSLRSERSASFPLLMMGVYDQPTRDVPRCGSARAAGLAELRLNISREKYFSHIETIRDHIAAGDVYQITYCIKLLFAFSGDPRALYARLLAEQPVPYPALIETDHFHILSLSPEMFMKKTGEQITTKPMKGTWFRGRNMFADARERLRFQWDAKNRAENVMIADLLRNDLGRVGTTIAAPRLFEIAKYRTLFQMTSTVTGRVDADITIERLFAALFPSGSVTGAPKIRAMQIIRELEAQERKIYTGAIGYIAPNKDLFFNIPIRTLLIEKGNGEMGIGGGIVWDSTPEGEWQEGLLKARFVTGLSVRQHDLCM